MAPDNSCAMKEVRHATLYFPDGDIVLSASKMEDSENITVLFRIDKIYLCRSSVVLRDLLSIPPQPNANEMYDGVVRVHMPDGADDLGQLLTTLYDFSSLELKALDPNMPVKVMGLAKLATKYQINSVRSAIQRSLREAWPQTLEQWDYQCSLVENATAQGKKSLDGKINGQFLDDMFPEPASAICLAVECDCPEILPSALYQLALIEPASDWDTCRSQPSSLLAMQGRTARWHLLDRENLWRVFSGKARIKQLGQDIASLKWFTNKSCCSSSREQLEKFARNSAGEMDRLYQLRLLQDQAAQITTSAMLCVVCRIHAVNTIRLARQAIWDKLSKVFKL